MKFKLSARKTALTGGSAALLLAVPFIADFEGLRTEAYLDVVGIPTICYGSTQGVSIGDSKTKEQCDALLTEEVARYMAAVDAAVKLPLPAPRRAALTSFTYNVGVGAFQRSTLLKKLNAGDTAGACAELKKWVFARGRLFRGLVRRRDAEYELCMKES